MVSLSKMKRDGLNIDNEIFDSDSLKLNKDVFENLIYQLFNINCKKINFKGYKIYLYPKENPKYSYIVKVCEYKEKIINNRPNKQFIKSYLNCLNERFLFEKILNKSGLKNINELKNLNSEISKTLFNCKSITQLLNLLFERSNTSEITKYLFEPMDKKIARNNLFNIICNKKKSVEDQAKKHLNYKPSSLDSFI
jgi:hypothetical protein